ncbi:uncharacterized protein LOC132740757 [Ruditapes philippinarum]|uniref:uncharacterized protein LOC132740757 n=1 Tax=Ruditapes philippinarum TaxID=129788 RepID=UPI00295BD4D9|nr:uncharacterized protein LOC132740757 [Ruditapes philippinarum]
MHECGRSVLKPLIVYPGVRFNYDPPEGFADAVFGRTESGWMDSELFVTWLTEVFETALSEREIKRPVVLFVDGHSTHCTLEASKFCRDHEIILYCLPEHASHLLQPCDLKLFSSLKDSWKQAVLDFQIANIGEYVTKQKFAAVFKQAWEKSTTVDIAVKAFRDSGLFPMNPKKVLGTIKMEPSTIFSKANTTEAAASSQANPTESPAPTIRGDSKSDKVASGHPPETLVSDKGSSSCTSKSESHVKLASNADTILASSSAERVSGENLPQAIAPIMSPPSQNVSPAFTDVLKFPKA